MAPRLLTLLSQIEKALAIQGAQAVASPVARSINFHKGLARITFSDGSGSIHLQNFTLADGQICVRVVFSWQGRTDTGTLSVYPRESFDWHAAADQIASAWLAGQSVAVAPAQSPVETDRSPRESVAATG